MRRAYTEPADDPPRRRSSSTGGRQRPVFPGITHLRTVGLNDIELKDHVRQPSRPCPAGRHGRVDYTKGSTVSRSELRPRRWRPSRPRRASGGSSATSSAGRRGRHRVKQGCAEPRPEERHQVTRADQTSQKDDRGHRRAGIESTHPAFSGPMDTCPLRRIAQGRPASRAPT